MSQAPSVQCLFCHSRNRWGANYCERCEEQLDLQPCNRCGAVDHRSATACHKCGGQFSLSVAPGFAPLFRPAVVDQKLTHHHASSDKRVADPKVEHIDQLTQSRAEELPVDDVRLPEPPRTAAKARRGTFVAVASIFLFLVATAASIYWYSGRTAQPVRTQVQVQVQDAIDVSNAGKPEDAARTDGEAGMATDAAPTASPLPAPDAELNNARNQSVVIDCQPAVATLGLCDLHSQKEKP